RHQEILRSAEKAIAAIEDSPAMPYGREINKVVTSDSFSQFRNCFAKHAQPRHSTIGKNIQPDMSIAMRVADRERVLTVSPELRTWKDFRPRRTSSQLDIRLLDGARFQRARFGKVPAEVAGINDYLRDQPRYSQLHDAPIVPGSSAAARHPSVHPLAPIGVFVLDPNRFRGFYQILFRSKEIVVRGEYTAAHAFRGKIQKIGEFAHASPRRNMRPRRPAGNSPDI